MPNDGRSSQPAVRDAGDTRHKVICRHVTVSYIPYKGTPIDLVETLRF